MWKTPPSGRKCIVTVDVIIELVSEAFRTSSPTGEPLPFVNLNTRDRTSVRAADVGRAVISETNDCTVITRTTEMILCE